FVPKVLPLWAVRATAASPMADDAPLPDEAPRSASAPEVPTAGEVTAGVPTQGEVTAGEVTAGEVTAGVPTQGDPTQGDPTQGDPTAGVPTQGEVTQGEVPIEDWGAARWGKPRTRVRQKLLIGFAFFAPLLVIGASVYFIVWGGGERAQAPLAVISARSVPSSAPRLFPGEVDEDAAELGEPSPDAGHSLEQPNQAVPDVAGADTTAPGAALPPGFEDDSGDEEPAPSKPAPPKHF